MEEEMPRRELALAPEPLLEALRHRLYRDMRVKLAAPSPGSFRNKPVPSISPVIGECCFS